LQIEIYESNGKNPYEKWFEKLDYTIKNIITKRLTRIIVDDYFGNVETVGYGVSELKFDIGVRIYFGKYKNKIIILLYGGNKKNQQKDIKKAIEFWKNYLYKK
jgi:putative addiction module killer protein